ncbi:hypothetical protein Cgig2_014244 [Carnegiea gigantea]|uniref:DUF4283 domain-containing protein n=1 Tax=Carnegiea gigantea TaxID=171969 RepID=A0A9Q1Q9Y4_9CARY|nr:hypothetical protein Cgig2_014244 [Carnegiea gigantea]
MNAIVMAHPTLPVPPPITLISTYASLVDPEEGTDLKFVPTTVVNGLKCAQLLNEDVDDEIAYWQNALIYFVLGANPPFEVQRGVFLVRFTNLQDKIQVEKKGIYCFDSKPFLVESWNPETDLHIETIKSLPLWVHLPNLDIKYWGLSSLSKICSVLRIPIKMDRYTKEKTWIRCARVLIDISIEGPFPESVEFINELGVLVRQPVHYEWVPIKCQHCGMFGHDETSRIDCSFINGYWHYVFDSKQDMMPLDCQTLLPCLFNFPLPECLNIVSNTLIDIQDALQHSPGDPIISLKEEEMREKYTSILSSNLSLSKQQGKFEWIRFGDDNTKLFFAKTKQRKHASYIFTIKDGNGQQME